MELVVRAVLIWLHGSRQGIKHIALLWGISIEKDVKFPTFRRMQREKNTWASVTFDVCGRKFLANCRMEIRNETNWGSGRPILLLFFFLVSSKIGAGFVTRSMDFFFSCIHSGRQNANLMTSCISKELHIKEKKLKKWYTTEGREKWSIPACLLFYIGINGICIAVWQSSHPPAVVLV